VGLSGAARRANLRGAFAVDGRVPIRGRRVALVDDVCTTGTTLLECAEVLRAAGAAAVFAITVSRG
jgi:predicted amidophosphoribosyltransferase